MPVSVQVDVIDLLPAGPLTKTCMSGHVAVMTVPTDTLLELTRWENDLGKQVTAEVHKKQNVTVNMCRAPRLNIACSSETAIT